VAPISDLDGKVAVVTGAASGIGLALARSFLEHGLAVVCADLNDQSLRAAVDELRQVSSQVIGVTCNVADPEAVEALRDATFAEFGTAHIVCNNAGVGGFARMTTGIDVAAWRRTIDVDLFGVLHGIRAFLPRLLEQNEGHFVNTASRQGLIGSASTGAYCAAKFGVVGLSEVLAAELLESGSRVGVSVLCPGPVNTDLASPGTGGSDIDEKLAAQFALVGRSIIEPDLVAPLVLRAITTGTLYLSTHEATIDMLHERHQRIIADFETIGSADHQ
jgi:NAD(P)-dependent dehydrogenase (short-subunit alcohol dehydrogenase family)